MSHERAWILLPSGRRLDLHSPDPLAWTDRDLAIGLSRTYRWAGYSAWDLPMSVAQHSLTVLALCEAAPGPRLTPVEALRELLHDAVEALMGGGRQGSAGEAGGRPTGGGWDPITPLKPHLGDGFIRLVERLQEAVDTRYALPSWTDESQVRHKQADRLAAASEAHHVAGWSRTAMREHLGITLEPIAHDPLRRADRPDWEPWPPRIAEERFLGALQGLSTAAGRTLTGPKPAGRC